MTRSVEDGVSTRSVGTREGPFLRQGSAGAGTVTYERSGFVRLTEEPIPDSLEPGKSYFVMAKRVAFTSA